MKISFQKKNGDPSLRLAFFWKMEIETKSPITITDHFIPELFFDYFFIKKGKVKCIDKSLGRPYTLPRQGLKTIHTRPLIFVFSTPLVLFGARFSLRFAESFWEGDVRSNHFLEQKWVSKNTNDLESFVSQTTEHIQEHQVRKQPYAMLLPMLEESSWLVNFSPRHKRRLYKKIFGLSKKEIQNIRNIHSFLEQTCDFASQYPRIIQHVNPEVFYDQPHLNHTFKKMTGFSPVEYFQANSILQDNLMSASYNENSAEKGKL
jgi:AraC-like DNA-binding protein